MRLIGLSTKQVTHNDDGSVTGYLIHNGDGVSGGASFTVSAEGRVKMGDYKDLGAPFTPKAEFDNISAFKNAILRFANSPDSSVGLAQDNANYPKQKETGKEQINSLVEAFFLQIEEKPGSTRHLKM